MFKIIIADDEAIFREYMRTLIDWEQYGFEVCCEARNGTEALELIKEHKPDIALVDINMPFLDGLGLVEQVNALGNDMSIILITGHSEFEYARKAVKLGVVDYILKPFDKEELVMTLLKIKGNLQKLQDEKDLEKNNFNHMKERFLNLLISGELIAGEEEILQQLKRFGIALRSSRLVVSCIEIDNMYNQWSDAKEIVLWKFAVSNIVSEIMSTKSGHFIFNGPEGRIISILELDRDIDVESNCIEMYRRACDLVKRYLRFTITIGVGNPVNGIKAVRGSYLESLVALQNKLVAGDTRVISVSNLGNESMNIGFYPNEINEKLILALRTNDREDVMTLLGDVFNFIKDKKLSFEYVFILVMGLVSLCLSYINEIGKNTDQVFGKDFSPYSEIKNKTSLEELHQWSVGLFETALSFSEEGRHTKSKKIVDSVKEYIEENYFDSNLSVEGIANDIFINSSYLRKVFKKELNMSVSDYIVDVRMQKAKELIGSGNIKLSDISERVGYSDAGYFSKSFKRKFGFSPSEYENLKNR
ncbi:MAG: response regulator [Clostridia bacterium]|nr:response regulator [Clostridia bacterium]